MTFDSILIIIAGIVGVAIVAYVAIVLFELCRLDE